MESSSLKNFLAVFLLKRLEVQLDLPEISHFKQLLSSPYSLTLEQLTSLIGPVSFYLDGKPELKTAFLDLVHSLILHIYLNSDLTPETSRVSIEKIQILSKNPSFNLKFVLSEFENKLIKSISDTKDLKIHREWAEILTALQKTFNFDTSGLFCWVSSKISEIIFSSVEKAEEEEMKFLMVIINDFQSLNFPFEDLKVIIIDSALYLITTLINSKALQGISRILGVIQQVGVPTSLQQRFQKFASTYGVYKETSASKPVPKSEVVLTSNQLKDLKMLYTRDVKLKDESYTITVHSAKIISTEEEVAIKSYKSFSQATLNRFEKEVEILRLLSTLQGPYLKFYGSFCLKSVEADEEVFELGIVMEFCPLTLAQKIESMRRAKKEFSELELVEATRRLLEGFVIMSEQTPKIYHQDIKPENIYYNKTGELVIGDFNISTLDQSREATTTQGDVGGTVRYMAPEVRNKVMLGLAGRYRRSKVDVYSFGVTLFQMYTREPLTYNDPRQFQLRAKKIQAFKLKWFAELVTSCLEPDYRQRPSFKELLEYLPTQTIVI